MAWPTSTLVLVLATVSVAPAQQPSPLAREVVAALREYDQCSDARRGELDAVLRAGLCVPAGCDLRMLSFESPPGPARELAVGDCRVSIEVTMTKRPNTTVRVMGSLDPAEAIVFGRQGQWSAQQYPRAKLRQLVAATQGLLQGDSAGAKLLVACDGLASSSGKRARYRYLVPVGAARIEASIDLSIEASELEAARSVADSAIEAVAEAMAPLVVDDTPHGTASLGRVGQLHVYYRGVRATVSAGGSQFVYRVCGVEVSAAGVRCLADTMQSHQKLGRKVWARSWSVAGYIEGRGFLVLHCPREPPVSLPDAERDDWLGSNAQASLITVPAESYAEAGAAHWSVRPLGLEVTGGAFPKPFQIELVGIDLSVRWPNPGSAPTIRGERFTPM